MKIGSKEYKQIDITDKNNNLLASIIDENVITLDGINVVLSPVESQEVK